MDYSIIIFFYRDYSIILGSNNGFFCAWKKFFFFLTQLCDTILTYSEPKYLNYTIIKVTSWGIRKYLFVDNNSF